MMNDGEIDFSKLSAEEDVTGIEVSDVIFTAILDDNCESLAAALDRVGL